MQPLPEPLPRAGSSRLPFDRQPIDNGGSDWPALDSVCVAVQFLWRAAGSVTLDDGADISFPTVPPVPGLYRITLRASAAQRERAYVGEAANLRRRLYGYRRPGPSQQTNQRLNGELRAHLGAGGTADLAVALSALTSTNAGLELSELDLTQKASRLLTENAALSALRAAGVTAIVNLG